MRILPFACTLAFLAGAGASQARAQGQRLDHPGLAVPRLRTLCAERAPGGVGALQRRQRLLVDSLNKPDARRDPDLLGALACVDAMLYVDSPMVRVRRDLVRSPYAWQATDAFKQVSQTRPADSVAAIGLATLAFDIGESSDVASLLNELDELARTAYGAVRAGVAAPIVLRMCTEFTMAAGDFATARRCIDLALQRSADPSWHLERQALLSALMGNAFAGAESFDLAVLMAHDSAAQADVAWRVAWLVDTTAIPPGRILAEWRALSDSARVAWLHQNVEHGAATTDDASPYIDRLARTLLNPHLQGPILERCPLIIFHNGAEQGADHSGCRSDAVRTASHIDVSGQLLRLWNPATGAPIGVLGYALERRGLKTDTGGRFDARTVSVAVNVRQYEWETAGWRDTTVRATLPLSNDVAGPPLTGYLTLPLFRGTLTWTLAVQQPGTFGATSTEGALALGDRGYQLSELVLGVAEQGLSFPLDGDTITLAPLNVVKRKKPLELYFQLRSDSTTNDLRTNVVLHRIVRGEVLPEAEMTLATRMPAHAGINVVHRELNIAALVGGDHELDLQVLDAAGHVVARRTVNLLVR